MQVYGLNKELLATIFHQVQNEEKAILWHLEGVPNAEFYVKLHPYLKRWPVTCNASKSAIGRFYIKIDRRFADKGSRADNAYRYVNTFIYTIS